ncbi:MAG: hypothetical protein Q8R28_15955, partial [Dehalococcoidia bacterium]|nr:hypothetical protein [Dehalococcoidia bacterium]
QEQQAIPEDDPSTAMDCMATWGVDRNHTPDQEKHKSARQPDTRLPSERLEPRRAPRLWLRR